MRTLEREVLFDFLRSRAIWLGLTLGVAGYASGHAGLALTAGALAQAIGQAPLHHTYGGLAWLGRWTESLAALSYVGLVSALVKAASSASVARSEALLGATVAGRLRIRLIRSLLQDGFELPAPRMLASLAVRLREVESGVTRGVVTYVRAISQLVPLGACLITLSPRLAAAAALTVVPFAATVASLRGRSRKGNERAQLEMEELECSLDELVRNADLFRTYGAGEGVVTAIDRAGVAAGVSAARVETVRAALSGGNEVMGALAVVGAVVVAGRFGVVEHAGVLLPFSAVFFMAYRPLRDLGDARGWIHRGEVALSALRLATTDRCPTMPDITPARTPRREHHVPIIEMRALGATARGFETSCRLVPGEIVCLVGPTGSGKTTLFRVLLGLEPARGSLLLDGEDVTTAPAGPTRRPFAWVPQEAPMVTGTVAENILLLGGDRAGAEAALRIVGALDLLRLSDHERIGPGGRPLSGGERRKVAIARALVSALPVLLLDEPTEGLDEESARTVRDAISRLRGVRTVLIATHRQDVVAVADRVVRLGAPADLLAAE